MSPPVSLCRSRDRWWFIAGRLTPHRQPLRGIRPSAVRAAAFCGRAFPSPTGTSAPVRIETGGPTSPRCRPGLEPELHPARVRWRHAVQGRPGRGRLTLVRRPEHIPVLGQAIHTRSPSPAKPYATTRPTRSPGTHNPARVGVPLPSPRSRAPSAVLLLAGTAEDVEECRHLRPAQDARPSRFKTLIEQLEQEDLIIRLQHDTASSTENHLQLSEIRCVRPPTPIRWSTFRRTNGRSITRSSSSQRHAAQTHFRPPRLSGSL